jgi:hypothetical protein
MVKVKTSLNYSDMYTTTNGARNDSQVFSRRFRRKVIYQMIVKGHPLQS